MITKRVSEMSEYSAIRNELDSSLWDVFSYNSYVGSYNTYETFEMSLLIAAPISGFNLFS